MNDSESPKISNDEINQEIEELLKPEKKSRPNLTPVEDHDLPKPDELNVPGQTSSPVGDDVGFVLMGTKKKTNFMPFIIGIVLIVLIGYGCFKGVQLLRESPLSHIGKTPCCDGTWSDAEGSGTCSYHGGIQGVGCQQCKDGSWSTAKGAGACSRHGGLKDKDGEQVKKKHNGKKK